uniref:DUF3592 domain-containing protein n=1 Tax=Schlesneria paludicola TaxID=360056 RepID=A0A7C2NXW4_9PLAN
MWHDGETWWEVYKFRLAIAVGVMFLFSAWGSWQEVRYGLWGRTATASVTRAYRDRDYGGKRPRTVLRVEVEIPLDDGATQSARLTTSPSARIADGDQIAVRHIPGVPRSVRLASDANVYAVVVFGFCLVAMIGFVIWAAKEANRPYGGRYREANDRPVPAKVVQATKKRRPLKPLKPLDEE